MRRSSLPPGRLSDHNFQRLRRLAEAEAGVHLTDNKRTMLQARLPRRLREIGFTKIGEYCEYLFGEGAAAGERSHFVDLITTNFTYFYREPQQLDIVSDEHLPALVDRAAAEGRPLRAWSAACSTGQEVWTLGMMIEDTFARLRKRVEVQLVASDVSTRVLDAAARGVYPEQELERVPDAWRQKYFRPAPEEGSGQVSVAPALRAWTKFRRVNLIQASYEVPRDHDIVLLRNVLIYFAGATRQHVVHRIAQHIRPGGMFLVGAAESLGGLQVPLEHVGRSLYRREARP